MSFPIPIDVYPDEQQRPDPEEYGFKEDEYDDSLSMEWFLGGFLNPPYSKIKEFMKCPVCILPNKIL